MNAGIAGRPETQWASANGQIHVISIYMTQNKLLWDSYCHQRELVRLKNAEALEAGTSAAPVGVLCLFMVRCCTVWCGVVWCGVVQCGVVWCGVVWCGVVWCGVVWCGVVWCGVVWCGVVWCGVVWCGVVCRRRYYQKAKAGMSTHGYR